MPLLFTLIRHPAGPPLQWWTANGLEKVRPYDVTPKEQIREVRISAGRNEFEPFQIILRSDDTDLDAVDVEVSDLRGQGSSVLLRTNITAYLERYIDLKMPSSIEGRSGEWPDALIPKVDQYTNERRNAFPFTLSKRRNQPIWFDVYVPPVTPAGSYRGNVQVLIAGKPALSIPLELNVWNFELPSTSTLSTTFGFSGISAVRQHYGRYTQDKDVADLTTIYQKAGLRHRITIDGSAGLQPAVKMSHGEVAVDWRSYDAQLSPFLNGLVFSRNEPLAGAKSTSVALRTPPSLNNETAQIQFWKLAAAHFREKGWFERLFNYLWDEPAKSQYAPMLRLGEIVHRADPSIRNLVTAPLHANWIGVIDIWTPVVNCFEEKAGYTYCEPTVRRAAYDPELSNGKRLWWYQSCASHGCNIVGGDYFRGWPDYMIDDAPVRNRIMEWLSWKYRIGGELYFNTIEAYAKKDPWKDLYLYGGNGDGTLFYPGHPDVIGGTTHIPVESIRLKLIREGLEDYEYLTLLTKLKGAKAADQYVDSWVRSAHDYDQAPEKLYAVRSRIAQQLDGGL